MNKYYYHGIEPYHGCMGDAAEVVVKVLQEGLINRSSISGFSDDNYNHVCLYKKNDNYDYTAPDAILNSARGGWIDSGFVFVISPDIEAKKASSNVTDLVDEWRSLGNIPPTKIVGLALPYDLIKEYLNEEFFNDETELDKQRLKKFLVIIENIAFDRGIFITNSEILGFTDILDFELSNSNGKIK